jgi:hypothetical protein
MRHAVLCPPHRWSVISRGQRYKQRCADNGDAAEEEGYNPLPGGRLAGPGALALLLICVEAQSCWQQGEAAATSCPYAASCTASTQAAILDTMDV